MKSHMTTMSSYPDVFHELERLGIKHETDWRRVAVFLGVLAFITGAWGAFGAVLVWLWKVML